MAPPFSVERPRPLFRTPQIHKLGAVISVCGNYRYSLWRDWGDGKRLAFIMLNPSTADAEIDDRTVRRCIRFSRDAGYQGMIVGNLFGWRATDPKELSAVSDPIGPGNDTALVEIISASPAVVCAWGRSGSLQNRNKRVLEMIRAASRVPYCLRMTKQGHPEHPLYLPASLCPIPLE